jgi:hypothetical protein
MGINSWFTKLEKKLHLDIDPLNKFEYDPKNEAHNKQLDDLRKSILHLSEDCFRECVQLSSADLTKQEEKCIKDCLNTRLNTMKKLIPKKTE